MKDCSGYIMKFVAARHSLPAPLCNSDRPAKLATSRVAVRGSRVATTSRFVAAIFLLTLVIITSCGKAKAPQPLQEIETAKVMKGTIERRVMFTGNIVAKDAVNVFSRAQGRISKKLLKEGDPVKKGQGILTIDRDEIGYTFKPLIVDSPIDGYVGSILVDVGSIVYDRTVFSQNPVAVVVRPGTMRMKLDIPERYLGAIKPGTEVSITVDSLGGATYTGAIVTSSPVVSEKTRTANVEVELANTDGRLRHGMFGRTSLAVEQLDNALTVPIDAVSWEGEKQFIYRVADEKVHRTEIKTGMRNDVHVQITEGAAENETVAVGSLIDLKDGEAVVVKSPAGAAEGQNEGT